MEPDPELKAAIDLCYEIFDRYPMPRSLEASTLRDANALLQTLTSKPLRRLSGEDIGPYSGYALTTVGSVNDYRYFLPRILEEAVRRPLWMGTEPPVIARRLKLGEWSKWENDEQQVLVRVFGLAWRCAVNSHPQEVDAGPWLLGMAILGLDVVQALDRWRSDAWTAPVLHLANFLKMEAKAVVKTQAGGGSSWADCSEKTLQSIRQWLLGDSVEEWALMACDHVPPDETYLLDQALIAVEEARKRLKATS